MVLVSRVNNVLECVSKYINYFIKETETSERKLKSMEWSTFSEFSYFYWSFQILLAEIID